MNDKRKLEPPLRLDMDFGEAMSRFVAARPDEVAESVERSKTKKPPQGARPRRLGPAKPAKRPNRTSD
jgi:hypothetical protein